MALSPSSTVDGDQHDTRYVTFELLMHAAFVADEIWGFMLEPARTYLVCDTRVDIACGIRGVYKIWGHKLEPARTWYVLGIRYRFILVVITKDGGEDRSLSSDI